NRAPRNVKPHSAAPMARRDADTPRVSGRTSPEIGPFPGEVEGWASSGRSRAFLLLALLALHLGHPATWTGAPGLWSPAAGLGLALAACLGFARGAALLVAHASLVLLQTAVLAALGRDVSADQWALLFADLPLAAVEATLGWWLYRHRAGGSPTLEGPHS